MFDIFKVSTNTGVKKFAADKPPTRDKTTDFKSDLLFLVTINMAPNKPLIKKPISIPNL